MKLATIRLPLRVVRDFIKWHRKNYNNAAIDDWVKDEMVEAMDPTAVTPTVIQAYKSFETATTVDMIKVPIKTITF